MTIRDLNVEIERTDSTPLKSSRRISSKGELVKWKKTQQGSITEAK